MTRPELRIKFRIPAVLAEIRQLRMRLQGFLEAARMGFDERACLEVTMALDEAASNIVLHGYGKRDGGVIDVEYEDAGGELVIRLWDDGVRRDAKDCVGLPPGVAGEGGMGTNIMRSSMTSVSYAKCPDGRNLLEMRRRANHTSWTSPGKAGR